MFSKKVFISLDIGDFSVKTVVMGPNRKDIIALIEREINPERTALDQEQDLEQLRDAVRSALYPYNDRNQKYSPTIVCALQDEKTVCRYIEIPKLDKSRHELAVQSTVVKHISFPVNEAFLTHTPVPLLREASDADGVFFFALQKSAAARLQEMLGPTRIDRFEVPAGAMIKQWVLNHGMTDNHFVALVHVGSSVTMVVVMRNGNPYFARKFTLGGRDFTYAYQMGAQSTWHDAEEYKRGSDAMDRETAIEPILARWIEQIKKTMAAFSKQEASGTLAVDTIYLTGGGALWKGLDGRLSEAVNIPVVVDMWDKLKAGNGAVHYASFSIALGMAM